MARVVSRPALQAGLAAFLLGALAQWWAHRHDVVFAFWDAQAHLDIARRVTDSMTPGLQMLGTVWLPVPHLLLLPFTLVDAWWWNGLAGGLVGLGAYVVTVVSVHALLLRQTGYPRLAWLGTAFVLLNPSLLYLQTTAMTEPVLLAAMTAAVALLDRWRADGSPRVLLAAGALAALSVGSRYDGWFFVACAVPVVGWLAHRTERSAWRAVLRFAWPSVLMVLLWLGYNAWYFGDPLEFQRGVWSAQSQQAALAAQGLLPTRGAPFLATGYYLGAAALTVGPLLLLAAALFGVFTLPHPIRSAAPWLLLSALPFNVLALWGGQSVIALPWTTPAGLQNVRYGVMLLPGAAVLLTLGAFWWMRSRPGWRQGILLALLGVVAVEGGLLLIRGPHEAGALREGLAIRDGDPRQQHAADWLRDHYDGGRLLIDPAVNISPRSRLPIRERIYPWSWELGPAALAAPETAVDWIVVDRRQAGSEVARAIDARPLVRERFDRAFDEAGLEIWRRR